MSTYRKFRSRRVVEARQLEKDAAYYDPRTGARQQGHTGDWLVNDGGKVTIVDRERFGREYESADG